MIVQRSITTISPPSWAIRPASRLAMPSWSHRQRAPTATASRAGSAQRSARRNTSTMSTGPGRGDRGRHTRVAAKAVDHGRVRVDGDDLVAGRAELAEDAVGGPDRAVRRPDDGDPSRRRQQVADTPSPRSGISRRPSWRSSRAVTASRSARGSRMDDVSLVYHRRTCLDRHPVGSDGCQKVATPVDATAVRWRTLRRARLSGRDARDSEEEDTCRSLAGCSRSA